MPAIVHGMRELQTALARADKEAFQFMKAGLVGVAEPIQHEAAALAHAEIAGMGRNPKSDKWSQMRVGVTKTLVYVAPKQRGRRTKANPERYARGNLAPLLMRRAMQPALDRHEGAVARDMTAALDKMADHFNGGPV